MSKAQPFKKDGTYYIRLYCPNAGKFRRLSMFSRLDPKYKDPSLAAPELQEAWRKANGSSRKSKWTAFELLARADEMKKDILIEADSISLQEAITAVTSQSDLAPSTREDYASGLARFSDFLRESLPGLQLEGFKNKHILKYLAWRKKLGNVGNWAHRMKMAKKLGKSQPDFKPLAPATLLKEFRSVSALFRYLHDNKAIAENPCVGISPIPKKEKKKSKKTAKVKDYALSPEQAHSLLAACGKPELEETFLDKEEVRNKAYKPPSWVYPIVYVLLETGLRVSELIGSKKNLKRINEVEVKQGLKWKDVHLEESYIQLGGDGKTGVHQIVISEDLCNLLRELKRLNPGSEQVFEYRSTFADRLARAVRESGLDRHVRPHDLRHTCFTLLARKYSADFVWRQAGHSDISTTTDNYFHDDLNYRAKLMQEKGSVASILTDNLTYSKSEILKGEKSKKSSERKAVE